MSNISVSLGQGWAKSGPRQCSNIVNNSARNKLLFIQRKYCDQKVNNCRNVDVNSSSVVPTKITHLLFLICNKTLYEKSRTHSR